MKNIKLLFIFLSFPFGLIAQSDSKSSTIRFRHIGIMLGGAFVEEVPFGDDTVNLELEAAISINKHLVKGELMAGILSNIFDGIGDYAEYNVLYGREFQLTKWLNLELYGGAGYFSFVNYDPNAEDYRSVDHTIGFPLESVFVFPVLKWFSVGAMAHHNLNSLANATALGVQLQFKF